MPLSTSSLLASAEARRNKIQEQNDALVAYEFSLSAKTYDDFITYSNYLQQQIGKTSDPSKILSYRKNIDGARKGYASNEIQRANIDIIEGRGDNNTKYKKLVNLYYQALDNNDYDQAQTLNLQLDNLSVKIQQEQQAKYDASQRVAKSMASAGVTNLKDMVTQLKTGIKGVELANGKLVKPVNLINRDLKNGNVTNYFRDLYATTKAIQDLVGDAYNGATDQETINSMERDSTLRDIINGDAKFGVAVGNNGANKSLSMQDIELAYRSAAANNPIYSVAKGLDPTTGKTTYKLKENKIDDFAWTRNDDGSYSATQIRASNKPAFQGLNTQITDTGQIIGKGGTINQGKTDNQGNYKAGKAKGDDSMSIGNRLKSLGVVVQKQNDDGTIDVIIPNGDNGQPLQTQATLMPDGTLRYFGGQGQYSGGSAGLYELNPLTGKNREVAPDEASDFGNQSVFGGLVSQPSEAGKNYIKNLFGLSPVQEVAPVDLRKANITQIGAQPALGAPGGIGVTNDFSGRATPVTSRLLQGASFTSGNLLKEAQARLQQAAAAENARLQAAATVNLNQMPVRQKASNGAPVRQLTVAKPVAQPKVNVTTKPNAQNKNLSNYAVPAGNLLQGFKY